MNRIDWKRFYFSALISALIIIVVWFIPIALMGIIFDRFAPTLIPHNYAIGIPMGWFLICAYFLVHCLEPRFERYWSK